MTRDRAARPDRPVVLITGGGGFLGQALLRELQKTGADAVLEPAEIRVYDLNPVEGEPESGVRVIRGDVRSRSELEAACQGVDVVFHCAAVVDWGHHPRELVHAVNVTGTQNVLETARRCGVPAVVHTSSEDVVYTGRSVRDGDETLPHPARYVNAYCETKAEAERRALAANGPELRTAVIRPCGMFGEGDPFHVSSLLKMARQGLLIRVGNGTSLMQHVYVGNVAHLHLLAARELLAGNDDVAGQVYFATDFPAENFFDFLEPVIQGCGYRMQPWSRAIPRAVMYPVGCAMELLSWAMRPVYRFTPIVSRFGVNYVCLDFTFRGDKARHELDYEPIYSRDEAFSRTTAWFRQHGPVTR